MRKTIIYAVLSPSIRKGKKWRMVFETKDHSVLEKVDFGAEGMEDFTTHKDEQRKQRFLSRFQKLIKEYENDPSAPITLSKYILWNKPTIAESLGDYKKHFGLR